MMWEKDRHKAHRHKTQKDIHVVVSCCLACVLESWCRGVGCVVGVGMRWKKESSPRDKLLPSLSYTHIVLCCVVWEAFLCLGVLVLDMCGDRVGTRRSRVKALLSLSHAHIKALPSLSHAHKALPSFSPESFSRVVLTYTS